MSVKTEKKIDLLYEEYKVASDRIEDYQKSHFRYYSGFLLFIVTIFTFYAKDGFRIVRIDLIPYPVLLISLLIYYHYHRTLVTQGYRKALEMEINKLLTSAILNFHATSDEFIISTKNNLSIALFSVLNFVLIVLLIIGCSFQQENKVNMSIQLFLTLGIVLLFLYSTYSVKSKVQKFVTMRMNSIHN